MSLIDQYIIEYLGKVFYFCLKKTGQEQDAAELASNINFEILKALLKGIKPDNFESWVWSISRNQWSRWATQRFYKQPEHVDIQEYNELLSSEENIENSVVHAEDIERIRRELAFIRSDYREILVTHYFEEMSVWEISMKFSIPLGTVKTKLQSSRKILKEGMNMAREFGRRSFKPEMIGVTASGSQRAGHPWNVIGRLIPMNILCEANNNPSTIEELSMQLGIAVPYMEEEVRLLEEAELLRVVEKNKYITSFFISPKECKTEINEISCQFVENTYMTIWEMAQKAKDYLQTTGGLRGVVSDMDATAYLSFWLEQKLEDAVLPQGIYTKFERKDGGNWGIMGLEQGAVCRLPAVFVNNNCSSFKETLRWNGYQSYDESFGKRNYGSDVPEQDVLEILKEIAKGVNVSAFSVGDQINLKYLLNNGFCIDVDGVIQVAAMVFDNHTRAKLDQFISELPDFQLFLCEMKAYIEKVTGIVARYSVSYLKDDFDYYVAMSLGLRGLYAYLWKNKGIYTGGHSQFCAIYYNN